MNNTKKVQFKRQSAAKAQMPGSTTMKEIISSITGMVLGDANLEIPSKNARLRINHTVRQKKYLEWKSEILKQITGVSIVPYKTSINGKDYEMIHLKTSCHPFFTRMRKKFYFNGRKTVTEFLLKRLTPQGLAIWLMDDGGKWTHSDGMMLSTYNFNEAEHWLMKYWIEKLFGIKVSVRKHKDKYFLSFSAENGRKLLKICEPFILEEMKYKFPSDVNPPQRHIIRDEKNGRIKNVYMTRGGEIV